MAGHGIVPVQRGVGPEIRRSPTRASPPPEKYRDQHMSNPALTIRPATPADVAAIFGMIHELAVFEKLEHMVVANAAMLHDGLFGAHPACEAIVGEEDGT